MDSLGDFVRSVPTERVGYAAGLGSAIFGLYLLYKWRHGPTCDCSTRLDGKTVVVTGANSGIGKYTAIDMARRGARVVIACRDIEKAQAVATEIRSSTGNDAVVVQKLDLASLASVRECAANILASEQRLDILINNAGVMTLTRQTTADGFELQFGVNHLGHFLFTLLLLDLIKESAPSSRVINVSSGAHVLSTLDFDDLMCTKTYPVIAYGRSKLANLLFTRELAKRLAGTGTTTFALHPGAVATELGGSICGWRPRRLLSLLLRSGSCGAQTTIHCAVAPDIDRASGSYFCDCKLSPTSAAAADDDAAVRLWEISERLVQGLPPQR